MVASRDRNLVHRANPDWDCDRKTHSLEGFTMRGNLVRRFLSRHFSFQEIVERISQVHGPRQCKAQTRVDLGARSAVPIKGQAGKGQAYNAAVNAPLNNQISANRLNVEGICNLDNLSSELNASNGLGHKSFVLFVGENGEAYDLAGNKWSLA